MPLVDVNKLRRDKGKLKDEMRNLCQTALGRDDKKMTEQEGARYTQLEAEVRSFDDQILLAERNNALEMDNPGNTGSTDENRTEEQKMTPAEFLLAVRSAADKNGKVDPRLESRAGTGLNTASPEDGGFLVGTDMETGIMKHAYELSVLASRCKPSTISAGSNSTSWFELKETSRAAGSRNGGVRAYFVAEGGTVNASKPEMVKRNMSLAKLMAFVYFTEEQLQDGPAMVSEAEMLVGDEFACVMDDNIFDGPGGALPLGILRSDALIPVPKRGGQRAGTIVYENIVDMWSRLWARSRTNAAWFINQDCEPQLHTMAYVVGTAGVPVYLPAGGLSTSPYATMYGRPVIPIEQAKTVGTKGDIVLGDFSQYKLISKGGLKTDMSMHVRFMYDENVYRFTKRINGAPIWKNAMTPANGTNTLSPFVALGDRV